MVTLRDPDSPAWEPIAFDHITVFARSASARAVVCLTPRTEVQEAIVAPYSDTDPDPCADRHDAFAGVNGVYPRDSIYDDWHLASNPWTLNFDGMTPGDRVDVEARAVFGGASAMGTSEVITARGQGTASAPFSTIELALSVPPDDSFWTDCKLGNTLDTDLEPTPFDPGTITACPRSALSLASSPAITRVGTAGRVPASVASGCQDESDGVIVWKSAPVHPNNRCLVVNITGRFAQCLSGDATDPAGCSLSERCVPPATDIAILSKATVLQAQSISCVPAYPEPVQYVAEFRGIDASSIAVALRRGDSVGGCFFDIYGFTSNDCDP